MTNSNYYKAKKVYLTMVTFGEKRHVIEISSFSQATPGNSPGQKGKENERRARVRRIRKYHNSARMKSKGKTARTKKHLKW